MKITINPVTLKGKIEYSRFEVFIARIKAKMGDEYSIDLLHRIREEL
jgi:hypothetical protein